ncbi:RnfABCDGE type electron transport complex subunit B [Acetivibrio mesophilus]|uniref:Ion-translocating oxidoreductase complex subunit B n=1 Tax=Acetivibrio mesophilus TaxID=2487273 RepID=A0A4Q0I4M9_9FIRM|nr:RnfABCDGE type electron transport complex subunit B [Acetivibrio mesophilus]ODM27218.1 ferredoxin [Clostridium sp. Bc-iso-3]RXE58747.1 4Fe-4S dicluster domain-containing protein [Acetivibrio mesophilus]
MVYDLLIPTAIIGGIGLLSGLGLSIASKKFEVKVDERVGMIREVLPGANCGACGQTGCDAFAEGVVEGKCKPNACPVGGQEVADKIGEILGVKAEAAVVKVARVMCSGTYESCKQKYEYSGIEDCAAAAPLFGGPSACTYGCVGLGNCKRACPFDAIVMINGLARIIESRCKACEKCVASCPKRIIKIVPKSNEYTVACSSLDKGAVVRKNCTVGCIGCGKCSKVCQHGAIEVQGTLAKINPDACINCSECIGVCPTGAIKKYKCEI